MTKPVNDNMKLSCGYNISTDELIRVRIYWQKNSDMVVTFISGKEKTWPAYENRTNVSITSDPFIVILGLRPLDEGLYSCIIQKPEKKGTYKLAHLTKVMLSVTGQ